MIRLLFSPFACEPGQDLRKGFIVAGAVDRRIPEDQTLVNRRSFLKVAGTATTQALLVSSLAAASEADQPGTLLAPQQSEPEKPVAANDHIQIALIGAGGQGQYDTKVAASVPGSKSSPPPTATTTASPIARSSGARTS